MKKNGPNFGGKWSSSFSLSCSWSWPLSVFTQPKRYQQISLNIFLMLIVKNLKRMRSMILKWWKIMLIWNGIGSRRWMRIISLLKRLVLPIFIVIVTSREKSLGHGKHLKSKLKRKEQEKFQKWKAICVEITCIMTELCTWLTSWFHGLFWFWMKF